MGKDYSPHYSEDGFWNKIKKYAKQAGIVVLERAFTLYYCFDDSDTPAWAKAVIVGALGYFISPIDSIPDFVIPAGYVDDAIVLLSAMAVIHAHIKPEHIEKAKKQVAILFGE